MEEEDELLPLEDLSGLGAQFLAQAGASKAGYEATAVTKLMTHFGMREAYKTLEQRIELHWQRPVCFDDFHDTYPNFPFRMGVANVFGIVDLDMAELFKRFTRTPIYVAYTELMDELEVDRLAMVFSWPRVGKWVVIHNLLRDMEIPHPVFLRPIAKPKCVIAIETIDAFLAGTSWTPPHA
jgi:hypothetical protein